MDFNDRELKVVLQALYRFRGEVSGFSQTEQNKLSLVEGVIGKIEDKVGPAKAEKTRFDREMEESLAVLKTGRAGAAKSAAAKSAPAKKNSAGGPGAAAAKAMSKSASKLDKAAAAPKVKGGSPAKAAAKKSAGPTRAGASKAASK